MEYFAKRFCGNFSKILRFLMGCPFYFQYCKFSLALVWLYGISYICFVVLKNSTFLITQKIVKKSYAMVFQQTSERTYLYCARSVPQYQAKEWLFSSAIQSGLRRISYTEKVFHYAQLIFRSAVWHSNNKLQQNLVVK